jgi:hypothetical protein
MVLKEYMSFAQSQEQKRELSIESLLESCAQMGF